MPFDACIRATGEKLQGGCNNPNWLDEGYNIRNVFPGNSRFLLHVSHTITINKNNDKNVKNPSFFYTQKTNNLNKMGNGLLVIFRLTLSRKFFKATHSPIP